MEILVHRHRSERPWSYRDLMALQDRIAARVSTGGEGALIFSEVAPVITIGRRTPSSDILRKDAIPRVEVERGGLATYHGPGQWVVFAVDHLERLTGDSRGVRKMMDALLDAAVDVGAHYRPRTWKGESEELGAWSELGKYSAVGIQIRNRIVLHGLAVNGFRTEESFSGLRPCGLDRPVDWLLSGTADESGKEAGFLMLRERLENALLQRLWKA